MKVKVRMITYLPLYAIIMLNSMCNIFRTTFSKLAIGYFCKYFALQIFFCQIEQNISCIIKCEHCLIILCKQFNSGMCHIPSVIAPEKGLAAHISFTSISNSFASRKAKSNRILESFCIIEYSVVALIPVTFAIWRTFVFLLPSISFSMKELYKERNNLYEKQNDLKEQKQKIEKLLER